MKFKINDLLVIRDEESFYDGSTVIVKDIKKDDIDKEIYRVYDFIDKVSFGVMESQLEKPSKLEVEKLQGLLKDFENDYLLLKLALKNLIEEK